MGDEIFSNKDPFVNSFVGTNEIEDDMQEYKEDLSENVGTLEQTMSSRIHKGKMISSTQLSKDNRSKKSMIERNKKYDYFTNKIEFAPSVPSKR